MAEILTVQEVADYLRVSRSTVWRWCKQGKLNAFKAGSGWRVQRSELEKLFRQKYQEGNGELKVRSTADHP
jgi:excisionase family DNA binding protein